MVAFKVVFTFKAREDLRALDTVVAQRILDKIKWLSQNADSCRHQALTGEFTNVLRLRVGDWRILYTIDHSNRALIIELIKHRSEVYKSRP